MPPVLLQLHSIKFHENLFDGALVLCMQEQSEFSSSVGLRRRTELAIVIIQKFHSYHLHTDSCPAFF
jgi:hypothetical protein